MGRGATGLKRSWDTDGYGRLHFRLRLDRGGGPESRHFRGGHGSERSQSSRGPVARRRPCIRPACLGPVGTAQQVA